MLSRWQDSPAGPAARLQVIVQINFGLHAARARP